MFQQILLTLLLPLALWSCIAKRDQISGPVLNVAVGSQIKGMDPIYTNDLYSSNEVARIYEGLLEYHYLQRPYALKPNLAEAIPRPSKNGLIYTFKIKKGIKFQDDAAFAEGKGRELTAQDFVYSIKRLADPKLQGLGWWLLDGKIKGLNQWRDKYAERPKTNYDETVEGLKALDSHTLQFTLSKPFPQFLYALAMPFTFAVAREVVDRYGKEFLNHPVGTGPFMIQGGVFKRTKKIVYLKNPNYREKTFPCEAHASAAYKAIARASCGKRLPLVNGIVVNIIEEEQPRWLNFRRGNVDFLGIPKDNFEAAVPDAKNLVPDLKEKGIELLISPSLDVTYSAFNHDLKLFQSAELRRAMSLAYDIGRSNQLFYNNTGLPAQSLVPPGIAGHIEGYRSPYRGQGSAENLKRAKELLAKAGYPGGKGLPEITYDCPSGTTSRQIGEYFKKQMEQIGVNIRVVQNPWPELQKKITTRKVMTYGIAWGADYPDAENFLQLLYGPNRAPGANGSGYDNPKFNRLFARAALMQDSPQRTQIYQQLNRMAAEEAPLIYGVHRQAYILRHAWLVNYVPTDFSAGMAAYLDIDLKKKAEVLKKM